ncbi:MAG: InlB B-repeat-containing protein [Clostridia bacterium]|nr:InlB B-repeat-containing protein [Clostridia bacterium]
MKKILKRTLSMVLCLAMLITTFFIFDPSILKIDSKAWVDVDANTMGSSIAAQRANAPETIYLKPGADNFEYFSVIDVESGKAGNSKAESGAVTFSNPDATDVKLYVNNLWHRTSKSSYSYEEVATSKLKLVGNGISNGQNIAAAKAASTATAVSSGTVLASGTNSINVTIDANSTLTGAIEGDVYIIEWVVAYVVNGSTRLEFMYTGIYKPRLQLTGVSGYALHDGTLNNTKSDGFGFITGAMDYAAVGNRSHSYTNTSGAYTAPLIRFIGQANDGSSYTIPSEDYRDTKHFPETTPRTVLVCPNRIDEKSDNFYFRTNYTDYGSYTNMRPSGTNHNDVEDGGVSGNTYLTGVAYMVVDKSRFTDYSQIPNLSVGYIRYYFDVGGGNAYLDYIQAYDSNYETAQGITASVDRSDYKNGAGSDNARTWGLYSLNGAIPEKSKGVSIQFKYRQNWDGYLGIERWVNLYFGVGLHTTVVDKDAIRQAYCEGLKSNIDRVNDSSFSSYYSSMKTQALILCDPTATTDTVSISKDTIAAKQKKIVSSNTSYVLTFYVPEVIYLKPSTGNMKEFQYYVDRENADNGALRTGENTTGNVYLNVPGATSVSVACTSGASVTLSKSSDTSSLASTITAGTLLTAISQNTTTQIEWTATYVINSVSYSTKAYSIVYAPCLDSSTGATNSQSKSYQNTAYYNSSFAVIYGITGIRTSFESTLLTKAGLTYYIPTIGAKSSDSDIGYWSSSGSYAGGFSVDGAATGYPILYPTTNVSWRPHEHDCPKRSTSMTTSMHYAGHVDKKESHSETGTGGIGYLVVDNSRYTKFNMPNLTVKAYFSSGGGSSNCNASCIMSDYEWNNSGVSSLTAAAANSSIASSYSVSETGQKTGDIKNVNVGNVKSFFVKAEATNTKENKKTATSFTACEVVQVNKAELRRILNEEISTGKQSDYYKSNTWNSYINAIKDAYLKLGSIDVTQAQIDSAKTNINTTASGLEKETSTATANHISTVNAKVLENPAETETYTYGDTVSAGSNEYTGYTFDHFERNFDGEAFMKAEGSKTGKNVSSVTWNDTNKSLTFKSTSTDSNGNPAIDNYTSMPTASNLYFLPVKANTTYKLSYTASGTTAQVYEFMLKDISSSYANPEQGRTDPYRGNYGLGDQSITFTTTGNCNFISFRFGNTTPNATTTFTNIKIEEVGATEDSIKNVCSSNIGWTFYYTPNKYDVTYDPNGGTFNGQTVEKTYANIATYDSPFTVGAVANGGSAIAAPTREGYKFDGWLKEGVGEPIKHGKTANWVNTTAVTYTAKWTALTYNVYYVSNGGSPTKNEPIGTLSSEDTITTRGKLDLPYTNEGYRLAAWGAKSDSYNLYGTGTNAAVLPGDMISVAFLAKQQGKGYDTTCPNLYLYAHWENNTYSVSYDNYFSYEGWHRSKSEPSKRIIGSFAFHGSSSEGSLTDLGNGSFRLENKKEPNKEAYTEYETNIYSPNLYYMEIPANTSIKFMFDYRRTAKASTSGDEYVADMLLFFFDKDLKIINPNGEWASCGTSNSEWVTASSTTTTPANCKYVAVRFDVNYGGDTCEFKNIRVVPNNGPYNETSYYGNVNYPATYTTREDTFTYSSGNTFNNIVSGFDTARKPTRTGYTFENWYTGPNGSGTQIVRTTTAEAKNYSLFAKWKTNTYNIEYDLAYGTFGTNHPGNATYDTVFKVSAPTRTGYIFTGWKVTDNLNNKTAKWGATDSPENGISNSSTVCFNGETGDVYFKNLTADDNVTVTLTATWTAETFSLIYDPNTTGDIRNMPTNPSGASSWTLIYDKATTATADGVISSAIPKNNTNANKLFIGWSTAPNATVAEFYPNGNVSKDTINSWYMDAKKTSNKTKTLYAVWYDVTDAENAKNSYPENNPTIQVVDGIRFDTDKNEWVANQASSGTTQYTGLSWSAYDSARTAYVNAKKAISAVTAETVSNLKNAVNGENGIISSAKSLGNSLEPLHSNYFNNFTVIDKNGSKTTGNKLEDMNLNHYATGDLNSALYAKKDASAIINSNLKAANNFEFNSADGKTKSGNAQELLNAEVAAMAKAYANKTQVNATPTFEVYETTAALSQANKDNIFDSSNSKGVNFVLADAGSHTYYMYTNVNKPKVVISVDDIAEREGRVCYPTTATLESTVITYSDKTESAKVENKEITNTQYEAYTDNGIGINHSYNKKAVITLSPQLSAIREEAVYKFKAHDDSLNETMAKKSALKSGNDLVNGTNAVDMADASSNEITIIISYKPANGFSVTASQWDNGTEYDQKLNQYHLWRTSGGANNWEIHGWDKSSVDDRDNHNADKNYAKPINLYAIEDSEYDTDPNAEKNYNFCSFFYIFNVGSSNNNSKCQIKSTDLGDIHAFIKENFNNLVQFTNAFSKKLSSPTEGLGYHSWSGSDGWAPNFYPQSNSYAYVHIIDRWGNVFEEVFKIEGIDPDKVYVETASAGSALLSETGGSGIDTASINASGFTILTDEHSTLVDNVYRTTGNTVLLNTGEPNKSYTITVNDRATNKTTATVKTDAEGNLLLTVEDDEYAGGIYTFSLNGFEINLYDASAEPAKGKVVDVQYVPTVGITNTYNVKVEDRANMVQFIELDKGNGTRSYDRYDDRVTIVSYDAQGNVVSSTSKDLAYEIWTVKSTLAEGNIGVRVKESGSKVWEDKELAYNFTNEYVKADSGLVSAELAKTEGASGPVGFTVVTGSDVMSVQLKNEEGKTVTKKSDSATVNADGTLTFTGKVWFHSTGTRIATVRILDAYGWHDAGTLEYVINK